ncbi:MAG: hypothetical protein LBP65_00380 [Puniceicoccales bacterium]|jgi:hypothetical protein|nr:hypothetical protein [Puniceicoccales bacterium]
MLQNIKDEVATLKVGFDALLSLDVVDEKSSKEATSPPSGTDTGKVTKSQQLKFCALLGICLAFHFFSLAAFVIAIVAPPIGVPILMLCLTVTFGAGLGILYMMQNAGKAALNKDSDQGGAPTTEESLHDDVEDNSTLQASSPELFNGINQIPSTDVNKTKKTTTT